MLQLKPQKITGLSIKAFLLFLIFTGLYPSQFSFSQGYDDTFEMKNKIKVELQYADYWEYEYPEPIVFQYGVQDYQQNLPYIANFPEKRGLFKFTRLLNSTTALSAKYQFSDIRSGVNQSMVEAKVTRMLGKSIVGLAGAQVIIDSRNFYAYQPGIGFRWDISPLTIIQADVQYYTRGSDAVPVGGRLGSWNLRAKIRQVLTLSTAVFVEYLYYDASGDNIAFTSHVVSLWLSQFLQTQTALHANLRWYDNSMGIRSLAPSIEIAQYINWATVLRVKYRYYANRSENVSLGEQEIIIPDDLKSHTVSVQLNRELSSKFLVYGKYRYYKSNLSIQMHTYMAGMVYSF